MRDPHSADPSESPAELQAERAASLSEQRRVGRASPGPGPSDPTPMVGGQAVIEGVMMRAPHAMAVAIRRPDGGITVRDEVWQPIWARAGWARVPFLRGAITVVESVMNGFRALSFAAEEAESPRHRVSPSAVLAGVLGLCAVPSDDRRRGSNGPGVGSLIVSMLFAITLFVVIPHALAWLIGWLVGGWDTDHFGFHLLDGLIKLGVFVGYVTLIGQIPEVARVFMYHGAEHKVVNAYERGRPLALDEVRLQGTFHARCGTSFILFVLVLSVMFFAVVLPLIPTPATHPILQQLFLVLVKVPLMIPVAGLAYEINRWAAAHPNAQWVQMMVAPGRWMQRLTTREPDDDQLEIALAAMWVALRRDRNLDPGAKSQTVMYSDLNELEAKLGGVV